MDTLDVRIFCEMAFKYADYNRFSERRISPTQIGRKLGLGEKAVRERVRKMEAEGFIKYYQAMPNLTLFGLNEVCFCVVQASDIPAKYSAIENFRKQPWVLEADDFLGPLFQVGTAGASSEEARKTISEVAGKIGLRVLPNPLVRKIRKPKVRPNQLDWRIVKELRYDALRKTNEIANALSITYRMAEYRISRLLDSGVFFVVALINPQSQRGVIFYHLSLTVEPSKQSKLLALLREAHGQKLWFVQTPNSQTIIASLLSFTPGELEEAQLSASKMDGVRRCVMVVQKEHFEPDRPSWIDRKLDEQITGKP